MSIEYSDDDRTQRRLRRELKKQYTKCHIVFEEPPIASEIGICLSAAEIGKFGIGSKRCWEAVMMLCDALCIRRGTERIRLWSSSDETALDALRFLEVRDSFKDSFFAAFSLRHSIFLSQDQTSFASGRVGHGRCGLHQDVILNHCQQFRDNERRSTIPLPMHLPDPQLKILACAAGAGHTVLISSMGIIFSCGRGAPQPRRMATRATTLRAAQQQLLENDELQDLDTDATINMATTAEKLLSSRQPPPQQQSTSTQGSQVNRQAALATASQYSTTPIALRLCGTKMRIVVVSASANHALFVTACGCALSSGVGTLGRLGHGNEANVDSPKKISALEPEHIITCAAGAAHSLFVTKRGTVYACGQGEDGRLGLGLPRTYTWNHSPRNTDDQSMLEDFEDERYSPINWIVRERRRTLRGRRASHPAPRGSRRATSRSIASDHFPPLQQSTVVPSAQFSFMQEQAAAIVGGLPAGATADRPGNVGVPKLVSRLGSEFITRVAAGAYHSLFLTQRGHLFSCGHNDAGQLGHNHQASFAPERVFFDDQDDQVISIAAGHAHTIVAMASGAAYAWGCTMRGALGLGLQVPNFIASPTKLPDDFGGPIHAVAAGGSSTALKSKQRIFVCGGNANGQLGLGHFNDVYVPTELPHLGQPILE